MLSTDTLVENFPGSVNGCMFGNIPVSVFSNQNPENGFKFEDSNSISISPSTHSDSPNDSGTTSNVESSESSKYSNPILRFISDILMDEEDYLEKKPCMLQDCLKLQAAEKSFYDVLGNNNNNNFEAGTVTSTSSESYSNSSYTTDNSVVDYDSPENNAYEVFDKMPQAVFNFPSDAWNMNQEGTLILGSRGGSREKRGLLMNDVGILHEEDLRSSKVSAVYSDDSELSEMFDEVLLCKDGKSPSIFGANSEPSSHSHVSSSLGSNGKTSRSKKGSNKVKKLSSTVDLWTLLTQCAQAVGSYDQRNANDILKQIRQHSSAHGDGLQRLAHYFADGLEARLSAGTPMYKQLQSSSSADMLKAYKVYITASPFQRMSNFLANRTILGLAQNKSSLHIIDFGVFYGFQWPCLIQRLSEMPQGPPRLRITGIDLPQPGFRPAERVEETGRRLEKYCKRFGVPFEYNCLAQKWDTIRLEDLKIDREEVTVVNCLYRLKNLSDETVTANCPRDAVLRLIRKINPNIFIHGVVNGTYNAPFFLTRFREALFHFSSLFDMLEATVPREDPYRLMFEKGLFGRDAVNVIACEGAERVERPETYKQWQVRNKRARFKQLPLAPELVDRVKEMVKKEYPKDFVVDEDGKWVLQGWKGRILHAVSCWVPA
ncbi:SCARECROW-like protein 14-like [Trifolium pratense]|uniref:SCARECROW-like protein 14-like n=1 Tax=Trifolium pratense TaxID=57577 RepID=A0A2K3MTJ4_TRIPR|nr:SCARECROW-like protein 14-like [Trifolium pratense]